MAGVDGGGAEPALLQPHDAAFLGNVLRVSRLAAKIRGWVIRDCGRAADERRWVSRRLG